MAGCDQVQHVKVKGFKYHSTQSLDRHSPNRSIANGVEGPRRKISPDAPIWLRTSVKVPLNMVVDVMMTRSAFARASGILQSGLFHHWFL
jgi:hypothetical protein